MNARTAVISPLAALLLGLAAPAYATPSTDPLCIAAGPSGARTCKPAESNAQQDGGQLQLVPQARGTPLLSEDSSRYSWRNGQPTYERPKIGNEDGTIPPVTATPGLGVRRP